MIDIPLIDELREIRRKLSAECGNDVSRYAKMLQEVAKRYPGTYVTSPLLPEATTVAVPPVVPQSAVSQPSAAKT